MKIKNTSIVAVVLGFAGVIGLFSSSASANLKEMKAYKEAFPDAKLKCVTCHAVERPSKEGAHGLNAYGQAVLGADANPTAETFKKVGKAEDFSGK